MKKFKTCTRCGRQFDENLTRCPHCGYDFYTPIQKTGSAISRIIWGFIIVGLLFTAFNMGGIFRYGAEDELTGAQTLVSENFDDVQVVNWSVYDLKTREPVFGLMNTQNGAIILPAAARGTAYGLTVKPFEVPEENYEILISHTAVLKDTVSYSGRLTILAADKAEFKQAEPVLCILYRAGNALAGGIGEGFYICEFNQADKVWDVAQNTRIAPVKGKSFLEQILYDPKAGKLEWYIDKEGYGGDTKICGKRFFFIQLSTESEDGQGELSADDFEIGLVLKDAA